jgi:hypothetical protein
MKAKEEVEAMLPMPRSRGRLQGRWNKKTLAALATAATATSSTVVVPATNVPDLAPTALPAVYTRVEGFCCFLVPVIAGAMRLLPLPSKFSKILGDFDISQVVIREGCGW